MSPTTRPIIEATGARKSSGGNDKKRDRSPSPSSNANKKAKTDISVALADAPPVDPCCVACAAYYNIYPGLVCNKAVDPEAPCLQCVLAKRECRTFKPKTKGEMHLGRLQAVVKAYQVFPNPQTLKNIEKQQDKFAKFVEPSKDKAPRGHQDKQALDAFVVKWALEARVFNNKNLNLLRMLARQRTSFAVRSGESLNSLVLTNPRHLEIAVAHLAGDAVEPCGFCQSRGLFTECVMLRNVGLGFPQLVGECTNCLLKKKSRSSKCSHSAASRDSDMD
ncbi:MAG: hypothetical protein Q9184_001884 [Pyrenodesmia sp. 2 TL-2023]